MNKRTNEILLSTIDDYIQTGEPVASTSLLKRHQWDCSSATVRHILNQLGKSHYLKKAHHSSGRIPTAQGYGHYAKAVSKNKTVSKPLYQKIHRHLSQVQQGIDDTLNSVSQFISASLNYTVILTSPTVFQEIIQATHLILIDLNRILLVLMTAIGINKDIILSVTHGFTQEELNHLSQYLSDYLDGKTIVELSPKDIEHLCKIMPQYTSVIQQLFNEINRIIDSEPIQCQTFGQSKMLRLPEFSNLDFAQRVLGFLDHTQSMARLFKQLYPQQLHVYIDKDCPDPSLMDCSLIVKPIPLGKHSMAHISILGPTRMVYKKVVDILNTTKRAIDERFETLYTQTQDSGQSPATLLKEH